MNILSLFDGMSCGYLALQKAGIPIDRYDAYEIDKYALKVSKHNFPDIIQHGDVFEADFSVHKDVDILMGGSPCTYWSIAQKNNRETEASGMGWELFSQYVRALHEVKPKFFVYENNKSMSNAIRQSISDTFGFEPILINSALVSAQNRQRLYWVGKINDDGTYSKVDIPQPEDKGILLKDILNISARFSRKTGVSESKDKPLAICSSDWRGINRNQMQNAVIEPVNLTQDGKSQCLRATCYKDGIRNMVGNNTDKRTCVAEPVCVQEQVYGRKANEDGTYDRRYEARDDKKSGTVTQTNRQNSIAEPVRVGSLPRPNGELSQSQAFRVYSTDGKSVNLTAGGGGAGGKTGLYAIPIEFNGDIPTKAVSNSDGKTYTVYEVKNRQITIKNKTYPIKINDGYYIIRKLTVEECKRLQTVPEWYDFSVISDTQAYKCLGNGWTVDIIAHLLSYCK